MANLLFKPKEISSLEKEGSITQQSRKIAINKTLGIILLLCLLMALIIVVLAVSSKRLTIVPLTNPEAAQDNEAFAFMSNVTGLDMAQYTMQTIYYYPGNGDPLYGQEMITYALSSSGNRVDAFCQFRNGTLTTCQLKPITGSPLFANAPSPDKIEAAKNILERLQNYYATSYLPAMGTMLNFTMNQNQSGNFLISNGNLTLTITTQNNIDNFEWSYTPLGISDTYDVVSLTTENGNFQSFSNDWWNLYKVGSTDVNVSQAQATQIAKEQALNRYSSLSGSTILDESAIVTLSLQNRGNFTLYPQWKILLPLSKPAGAVTEIEVLMWADTGQISYMVGA